MDTDLLVGAGLVSRLIVGGGSLDKFGLVQCVNRARESREIVSLDMTSLSVCFSYLAGRPWPVPRSPNLRPMNLAVALFVSGLHVQQRHVGVPSFEGDIFLVGEGALDSPARDFADIYRHAPGEAKKS